MKWNRRRCDYKLKSKQDNAENVMTKNELTSKKEYKIDVKTQR